MVHIIASNHLFKGIFFPAIFEPEFGSQTFCFVFRSSTLGVGIEIPFQLNLIKNNIYIDEFIFRMIRMVSLLKEDLEMVYMAFTLDDGIGFGKHCHSKFT